MATANIISLKWGYKYGFEYVNTLYSLICRHIKNPFRFICLTSDNSDLVQGIEFFFIPKVNVSNGSEPVWNKLSDWPDSWFQGFKYTYIKKVLAAWLTATVKPVGTKKIFFHIQSNPPDAIHGHSGKWYSKVLTTTWVAEHWK